MRQATKQQMPWTGAADRCCAVAYAIGFSGRANNEAAGGLRGDARDGCVPVGVHF
jgi:hypothetical protein